MPSPKGYVRNYKQERLTETKERRRERARRNAARKLMMEAGKVKKGDGKDVDHKDGNTQNNSRKNLRVIKALTNRSYKRSGKKYGNGKRKA